MGSASKKVALAVNVASLRAILESKLIVEVFQNATMRSGDRRISTMFSISWPNDPFLMMREELWPLPDA